MFHMLLRCSISLACLSLTEAGKAVQRALQQQGKRVNATAVAGLDAAEREQLLALLQRVSQNLATLNPNADKG